MDTLANAHPYGKIETIFYFTEDHELDFIGSSLKELLSHPEVKDRQIVSFLTIGAFRKGKSFFLNYCLRYLYATVSEITDQ